MIPIGVCVCRDDSAPLSIHAGKILNGFGKFINRCLCVTMFDAVFDAVLQVPFEHHLPHFLNGALDGINLDQNVLAGHVLVDHAVNRLDLSLDFLSRR